MRGPNAHIALALMKLWAKESYKALLIILDLNLFAGGARKQSAEKTKFELLVGVRGPLTYQKSTYVSKSRALCLIFMILVSLENVKKYSHVVARLPQRLKSMLFEIFSTLRHNVTR